MIRLQQESVGDLFSDSSFEFGDYWNTYSSETSAEGANADLDFQSSGDKVPTIAELGEPQDHFLMAKHVLLYIMMAIGVPANFLILYVSFKNRKKLPSSSWLVINLALSDFLLLLSVPLEVSR